MSTTTIRKGDTLRKRRTGTIREVAGFTTKPDSTSPSDGVRRARLIIPRSPSSRETRVRIDQIFKTYEPIA